MGFGKKDIVKNISSKALFTSKTSALILEAFLRFIKENKKHQIKISKFGTYYLHKSPARIGRNPKTKEEFKIPASEKLAFKASNKVKSILN
jgi:DNA-binding protein HU-beta|tara:strand:+ start:8333 stop:8605 length:273 start_codon:yes stop_codon:yes gene_type:complete